MYNASDIGKILRPIAVTKVSILVLVFSLFSTGWVKGDTIKSLPNAGSINSDINFLNLMYHYILTLSIPPVR